MSKKILRYLALTLGAVAMLGPFVWMLITSLTGDPQLARVDAPLLPDPSTVEAYQRLGEAFPFWRFAANSVGVAVVSTLLQLFTSATAAYAFSRLRFPGSNAVFVLYLATMMIPMQVIIVPLFIEMRHLGLVDSYAGLLLPTMVSSFGVFMLRQAFLALPKELDEAAYVDGAGHLRVFAQVLLPLVAPALATFAVFAFMSSWNAFLWPLVIAQTEAHMTLPVGLSLLQGRYSTAWNVVMAGSTLSVLPILALYVLAQRYVVRGITFTGIKS
ncbi:carbohydrate ABC transporter permease [Micromonospora narathiwatensis]|uniref:Carbohydrate ABC transporter membrane protein 2, CUT1 family n=1 Tax=Micromonospora narathiwatensis TaxID=299146 RepID=A0A1A8ZQW6_9ACTN|nr:carbohydrate ABC transporter permease [Micromonospora narathiwatensis]SBT46515.1 carbohydrate ABC transporter membrane protein 2, CUT1 family [Micromonospora narathiwatensis]